ncbi:hypothetical protein [Sulfitobacter pacificus]|uniref:hypothetical protein n=1 Tax=Sulfitobacter pacificus TaxID=1499314 RepID=UPI0031022C71
MKQLVVSGVLVALLSGCSTVGGFLRKGPAPSDVVTGETIPIAAEVETAALAPATAAPPPPPAARTVEALDTTTPEQRAAAVAPAQSPSKALGKTVVSLGSPTEPGLWMKTPLVKDEAQGRVTNPANGKSSLVTLLPLDGPSTAGSRMSLPALRLIGASLTDLTEVQVALEG